jgi:heme-degrading monooxygenase HmoA
MHVVIFRASIRKLDDEYTAMATRMRDMAINEFGCREFDSYLEGDQEVALSYWDDEDQIKAWRKHPDHLIAQNQGRNTWYKSYHVQVAQISREYKS